MKKKFFQIWSGKDGLSLPLGWLYLYLSLGLRWEAHPPAPEPQQQLVEQT
jgi:hypothetical protein